VLAATAIIGTFYIFMMYALSAGYRLNDPAQLAAFLEDPTPFPTLADRYASWMSHLIEIAAILGIFSCFLAVQNATMRVIFTMGRDGVLPRALGRVHPQFHSPYVALYAVTALLIGLGIGLAAWLGDSLTAVYGWTGSIGTVAVIIVYIMANLALIRFFAGDPERNILRHLVAPVLGIAVLLYPLYFVAQPGQDYPFNLVPILVLIWIVIGLAIYFYFRSSDPAKLETIGMAVADDDDLADDRLATTRA